MRPLTLPSAILPSSTSGGGSAARAVAAAARLANARTRAFMDCLPCRRRCSGRCARPLPYGASAMRDVHLVERGAQSLGQLLCVVMGPKMHEEQARLVVEHVIVDRRH